MENQQGEGKTKERAKIHDDQYSTRGTTMQVALSTSTTMSTAAQAAQVVAVVTVQFV